MAELLTVIVKQWGGRDYERAEGGGGEDPCAGCAARPATELCDALGECVDERTLAPRYVWKERGHG